MLIFNDHQGEKLLCCGSFGLVFSVLLRCLWPCCVLGIQNPSISLEVLVLGDAFSGFGIVEDLIDIVRADEISECENWAICKNHQYKKKSNILGLFLRYSNGQI